MEVGEIIKISVPVNPCGNLLKERQFEILKVYEKKIKEQDLILCKETELGYKECFQRFDLEEKLGIKHDNRINTKLGAHKRWRA